MTHRSKTARGSRRRALVRGAAWPLSLLLACPTAACASDPDSNFELIRYRLPETAVAARISLTLEECGANPTVSAELSIVGEAVGSAESFSLTTKQLKSALIKRELKLTLHETGAIATVGSSNENRIGAIVGDTIKFVAQVFGAFVGAKAHSTGDGHATPASPSVCSPEADSALARVKAIDTQLKFWREEPVSTDPATASAQAKAIDRLILERSMLRAGVLHADLSERLDLSTLEAAPVPEGARPSRYIATSNIEAGQQDLTWLGEGEPAWKFRIVWTLTPPEDAAPLPTAKAVEVCRRKLAPKRSGQNGPLGVCLPRPINVAVRAEVLSTPSQSGDGKVLASAAKTLPFPQWGVVEFLDLKGGDRNVSLTLDKFGRTTEASWTSKARAETIAAGLAGAAEQVSAFATANSTTARQKSEIDALTTQQTLNRLRACREILAAGGSACPAEASVVAQSLNGGN